jgi:hypothetical protein
VAFDEPREGRQLAGAKTSEEERAGIEQILVDLIDGAVQLQNEAAPAGDTRVVVTNRGSVALGFTLGMEGNGDRLPDERSGAAEWSSIEPGDSGGAIVRLEEGDYMLTALDPTDGAVVGTATLVVQPQQGLAGSGERPGRAR